MSEQELIKSCVAGSAKAQKALYDLYARKMMGVCLRYASDADGAQDLLQEGFIKVYTSLASYSGVGSFEGWMRRVFVNTALEHLRKNDVLRQSMDIEESRLDVTPDYTALEQMEAKELVELIAQLPTGFRTVFNMYAIEGYSHKEIAEALGINESTSRSQFTRAKQLLQKRLKELR